MGGDVTLKYFISFYFFTTVVTTFKVKLFHSLKSFIEMFQTNNLSVVIPITLMVPRRRPHLPLRLQKLINYIYAYYV